MQRGTEHGKYLCSDESEPRRLRNIAQPRKGMRAIICEPSHKGAHDEQELQDA